MVLSDPVVVPAVAVDAYRRSVAALRAELESRGNLGAEFLTAAIIWHLNDDHSRDLLTAAGTSPHMIAERAARLAEQFQPRAAATATTPWHDVDILLRQQIDIAWWSATPDFRTVSAVESSAELVDMLDLQRRGEARFEFQLASDQLVPRMRNYAVRRWFPDSSPGTPGPSYPYARPAMVGLLNAVADDFATALQRVRPDEPRPPLWVNCITRAVEDQCRLQELGFSAHLPSAHCRGWAADLEVAWLERFGARGALVEVLQDYQRRGLVNAIDEGRIWHICLNPQHAAAFAPPAAALADDDLEHHDKETG